MARRGTPETFVELVYRMPAKPTAGRVAVWRTLKRIGAAYLQDSVCVLPDLPDLRSELEPVLERIAESGGSYHLLPLTRMPADEKAKLRQLFLDQTTKQYDEIVEDCEVTFAKEVEFEHFRANYTYEEAEEIRMNFEKIVGWLQRTEARDWFGAANAAQARDALARCETLLEEFEAKVFDVQSTSEASRDGSPAGPARSRKT